MKNKWKIIVPILIIAVLAAAFYFGGNAPGSRGWDTGSEPAGEPVLQATSAPETPQPEMKIDPETGKDQYLTDPVPEGRPLPVEPQDVTIGSSAFRCTISICCSMIAASASSSAAPRAKSRLCTS